MEFDRRTEDLKPTKFSVTMIFLKDKQILLEWRIKEGISYQGLPVIPSGKVKLKEDPETTVKRESFEEYGINFTTPVLLGSFEAISPKNNHYLNFVYLKELTLDEEVINREPERHDPFWIDVNDAEEALVFSNYKYPITLLQKYLSR